MVRFNTSIPGHPLMVLRFTTPQRGPVDVRFFLDPHATHTRRRYAYNPRVEIPSISRIYTVRRVVIFHRHNGSLQTTRLNPRHVRLERDMGSFHHRVRSAAVFAGGFLDVSYQIDWDNITIAGIRHVSRIYMSLSSD